LTQPFAWAGIVAVEKASASAAHPRIVLIGNTSLSLAASSSTAMFFGIVTPNIRNPHTRRAYARACQQFFTWCEDRGLTLTTIRPFDVATYIESLQQTHSPPEANARSRADAARVAARDGIHHRTREDAPNAAPNDFHTLSEALKALGYRYAKPIELSVGPASSEPIDAANAQRVCVSAQVSKFEQLSVYKGEQLRFYKKNNSFGL
jgi:hypothetical protein